MATSGAVVNGAVAEASSVFVDTVRAAGGTVSSQVPGQPIHFTIKRPGNIWEGKNTPYDGTATLTPLGAAQTRIDVVVSCSSTFFLYLGLGVIFVFLFAAWLSPLIVLLALVAVVWSIFQATGPWAQEVANHVIAALPPAVIAVPGGTGPAATLATAPAPAEAPAANPASPSVSGPAGADIADQLKKLGELHATGILTDEEFQAKKTELLKRL